MIRLGQTADLNEIANIVKETIIDMKSYGSDQWNETYPDLEVFRQDIALGNLCVCNRNNRCVAFICIDNHEPLFYKRVNWRYQKPCLVIHRLAVSLEYRGQGIATELLTHAEKFICNQNYNYLRVDTDSLNIPMHRLLTKLGYIKVEEMNFLNKPSLFYCYDKKLN